MTFMAILKHIASKNADYGESERYLIFQHNEYTQKPVLDENGHMIIREEYYLYLCSGMSGNKCLFPQEPILQRNQISPLYYQLRSKGQGRTWFKWRTGTETWRGICQREFSRTPGSCLHPH